MRQLASTVLLMVVTACGGQNFVVVDVADASVGEGGGKEAGDGTDAFIRRDANDPDFYACESSFGSCVLTAPGCCGLLCGQSAGMVAVGKGQVDAFREATCTSTEPCPACRGAVDPNLFAVCASSRCNVFDVRKSSVSECKADADCTLAYARGCCAPCNGVREEDVVAINASRASEFKKLLCNGLVGCPECLTDWSPLRPACDLAIKHCVVKKLQ